MSSADNNPVKTLYLVDGSGYLFRAYHALPSLSTAAGEPTGAIYGVANMLRKLLSDYNPDHVAVIFDARGPTFRDELFEQYKATRPPMPEDLAAQVEPLKELVSAMGLPLLEVAGVEADDVIGTLVGRARRDGFDVVVSTSDKDLAQLVDDHVTLVNTMSDSKLDPEGVERKFGVPPERIVDYLALVGDSSDNIPGVPKVGPKTAAKWLNEYGSLDAIVAHAGDIKGKVGESLREHLEQLELSRQLATIRTDAEVEEKPSDLTLGEPDEKQLAGLLQRHEFNSWLKQLDAGPEPAANAPDNVEYETVTTKDDLDAWLKRLEKAGSFAFDIETTSLEYMDAELVGVSFAVEPGHAAYVPVAHDYPGAPKQLDRGDVLKALKPLLEDPSVAKIGQHFKYDMNVLDRYGVRVEGLKHDTMLASYVLNSTATRHDMDSLALKYLGHQCIRFEDVAGKGAKQLTFNQVALAEAAPYAAEDADITLRLHEHLWPELKGDDRLRSVYEEIEIPLVPVLSRMELTGVLVDVDRLKRQSKKLAGRMADLEEKAYESAGRRFNLGSPKQLQQILFEEQGIPALRKTPKGQPSTAEDVLEELAAREYELPRLILDYRAMAKLKSTYTDRLPERINARTGRVHTSYHQAVAATGRLSSSDPNLQNIPVRSEEGRRIRQAFVAPAGRVLLAADYSQIELRIMAHLSGDEGLLKAFRDGEDIHRATAAEVFGGEVTGEQRRAAKAINFGLIYGMSAWGLSRQLGIERDEAQGYVDRYFERYPGVKAYMESTRKRAREQGYVETVFGRRLYLPDIRAGNANRRQAAERAAINAPMQGTAADIIKRAMLAMHEWLKGREDEIRMIMQVHDELIFEVQRQAVGAVSKAIRARMEGAAELSIPLDVDIGSGENWDEAH